MFAKRFFYVCAGLLCLALAYHFGAQSATAQSGSTVIGVLPGGDPGSAVLTVMTPNGDVFHRTVTPAGTFPTYYVGNFWGGGATPATRETWGGVKARYRQSAPATPQDK